ncbi:MAG TPA: threonine synthase [Chitinophagaceae bacterium]|nr:threonine synthase [Chitinophagaceae bacterium]
MTAIPETFSYAAYLECARCKTSYSVTDINTYATCCNQPLVVKYDHPAGFYKEDLIFREKNMWRYFEVMPVLERKNIVTLGEGMTPILPLEKLSALHGFADILMKDESSNPTGSFKARGLSVAVSKAKELGVKKCIVPTAGNAGGALAAYCATAAIACTVVMPRHTPKVFKQECELYGATLILVDGLINDCAKKVAELKQQDEYYDVSTLKEPYRLEGKKTMGYEIAEQLNWQLPDVIIYPAGGGTGLIGIWKAFKEMMDMGWIDSDHLPKMIAVQSKQCAPVVRAFYNADGWKEGFIPQPSLANGLAVPYPFGMDMMQEVLHQSNGMAYAVSEEEIIEGVKEIARTEGIIISPEGAATWKALLHLRRMKVVDPADKILLLNTGSGYKYLENIV